MKKFRDTLSNTYWRVLYVGLTLGALVVAITAGADWD